MRHKEHNQSSIVKILCKNLKTLSEKVCIVFRKKIGILDLHFILYVITRIRSLRLFFSRCFCYKNVYARIVRPN